MAMTNAEWMIKDLVNWMMLQWRMLEKIVLWIGNMTLYMSIIGVVLLVIVVIKAWRSGLLKDDEEDDDDLDWGDDEDND